MVEFALVLPVLLLILTGILQFGLLFNKYITLTDAVRAGARAASVDRGLSDPCDPAVTSTVNSALDVNLQSSQVTVTPGSINSTCGAGNYPSRSGGSFTQGDSVTVSATITYNLQIFGFPLIPVHLTAHATDSIE